MNEKRNRVYKDNLPNYPLIFKPPYEHFNSFHGAYNNSSRHLQNSDYNEDDSNHTSSSHFPPFKNIVASGKRLQRVSLDDSNQSDEKALGKLNIQKEEIYNAFFFNSTPGTLSLTATLVVGSSLLIINLLVFAAILFRRRRSKSRKKRLYCNASKNNFQDFTTNDTTLLNDGAENAFVLADEYGKNSFKKDIVSRRNMNKLKGGMSFVEEHTNDVCTSNFQLKACQVGGNYDRTSENVKKAKIKFAEKCMSKTNKNNLYGTHMDAIEASTTLCTVLSLDQNKPVFLEDENFQRKKNDVTWRAGKVSENFKGFGDRQASTHTTPILVNAKISDSENIMNRKQIHLPDQQKDPPPLRHFSNLLNKTPSIRLISQPSPQKEAFKAFKTTNFFSSQQTSFNLPQHSSQTEQIRHTNKRPETKNSFSCCSNIAFISLPTQNSNANKVNFTDINGNKKKAYNNTTPNVVKGNQANKVRLKNNEVTSEIT